MIIISKDKTKIVNFDSVKEIMWFNECRIKIIYKHSESREGREETNLDRYNDEYTTKIAFEILCNKIAKGENVIIMPTEEEVKAYIVNFIRHDGIQGHNGKKRKGHGGS